MTNEFSVLLSVYSKEKPQYFDECLNSLLNQTVKAGEWVIVKDGPISQELQDVINKYAIMEDVNIIEVPLEKNCGLGIALSVGITECAYELVARMDTDDIAVPNRFEQQLRAFEENDIDICGGQIVEFEDVPSNPIGERRVPLYHADIVKYHKTRCAFNHMTVMYKKSKVLEAGNYKDMPSMEDDLLWVDMILHNAKMMNLDQCLCYVRTNRDMVARRGGFGYFKRYKKERKIVLKAGFITRGQYIKTNIIQFVVCMVPRWLRKKIFFGILHKRKKGAR